MPDLIQGVTYRGANINDVTIPAPGAPLDGISLEVFDWVPIVAVGYTEKRALSDGNDASDVYQGPQRMHLEGVIYGSSRARLFDKKQLVRAAFNAPSGFAEDPVNYGYRPLDFFEPTEDALFTPAAVDFVKHLVVYVRPLASPSFRIRKKAIGGTPGKGGAIPFAVDVEAKDPRIYVFDTSNIFLASDLTLGIFDSITNRGDYASPLSVTINVDGGATVGTFDMSIGGSRFQILVEANADAQIYELDGYNKILTVTVNTIKTLRMDLLAFPNDRTYPYVPAGTSDYAILPTPLVASSLGLIYQEAFA